MLLLNCYCNNVDRCCYFILKQIIDNALIGTAEPCLPFAIATRKTKQNEAKTEYKKEMKNNSSKIEIYQRSMNLRLLYFEMMKKNVEKIYK